MGSLGLHTQNLYDKHHVKAVGLYNMDHQSESASVQPGTGTQQLYPTSMAPLSRHVNTHGSFGGCKMYPNIVIPLKYSTKKKKWK